MAPRYSPIQGTKDDGFFYDSATGDIVLLYRGTVQARFAKNGDFTSGGILNGRQPGIFGYVSSSAQTTLGVDTFAKMAGTTSVLNAVDFTQVGNNSWRYDGSSAAWFGVDASLSVTTGVGADTITAGIAKGSGPLSAGDVTASSQQARRTSTNDVGNMGFHDEIQLNPLDLVEIWIKTLGGDDVTANNASIRIAPAAMAGA